MIKFLYVVSLGITSFLLFIFSKEKEHIVCNNQASGMVTLITDAGISIITDEGKALHPSSMSDDIILAVGQKIIICYTIDSSKLVSDDGSLPVHIKGVSYLSE
ncbi:MAG: hypothetical protein M9904_03625 [Chitinophagaceae bacterium]|nr:hypothetical protein [Chitinophagaceae bacterium]